MTDHLDIVLPIILIIIAFLLKLFMDRNATLPHFIKSLYELPVDIVFLGLTFTTAFTISEASHMAKGMFYLFVFLVIALINVVLWRRSTTLYEQTSYSWASSLFVLNATIAGYVLYRSVIIIAS